MRGIRIGAFSSSLALGLAAGPALGASSQPSGPGLTFGETSHPQGVHGTVANPASAATREEGWHLGIVSLGVGYELGDLDDFIDAYDTWSDEFDNLDQRVGDFSLEVEDLEDVLGAADDIVALERDLREPAQTLTQAAEDNAYLGIAGGVHAPGTPLVAHFDRLGGAITFDASASASGRLGVLTGGDLETGLADMPRDEDDWEQIGQTFQADGWELDLVNETLTDPEGNDLSELDADDLLDVYARAEGVILTEISGGYAMPVLHHDAGQLYVGGRASYYQAEMARSVERVSDDDAGDVLEDELSDGETETGFGLDAGALWVADWYQAGVMLDNINEPSFDYPVPQEYAELPEDVRADYAREKSYTLERQLSVEGAVYTANRRWIATLSQDLNSVEGPHGGELQSEDQWTALGAGWVSDSFWIPSVRLGYRMNHAGSELSFITGGLTLFRALSLDVAVSTDDVSDDDTTLPRSVQANLGLELRF